MKYKIGDTVTSHHHPLELGRVVACHYSSWSGRVDYRVEIEAAGFVRSYYEEDLELVEAPAQSYLDLFM